MKRRLTLPNDLRQIPQLEGFLEEIFGSVNVTPEISSGVNLALEEAVSNVMKYGYAPGSEGFVDIEALVRRGSLEFIVTDTGIPFDPTAAEMPDINLGVEERPIGGLGIYLVRTMMDKVSYRREDGRNILTMTKKI